MATLRAHDVTVLGPDSGDMACGEFGEGRMVEPANIVAAIERAFTDQGRLAGQRALITSGPTHEPLDPVRYIANRSSGKQGHAIAAAMARMGAETTLVTGPTREIDPPGVAVVHVETAQQMLAACQAALPVDVAVCAAAVSDWRPVSAGDQKIKKNGAPPKLTLMENPDILKTLATAGNGRPRLVVGFAAETGDVIAKAKPKLPAKGCDWIVANDVAPGTQTFGGSDNTVHLITADTVESWPRMSKQAVADQLASRIADAIAPLAGPQDI
jgi:phosphopantothenoylcysteine decarboxylase/phosphopantothenate--cysteine ligase